MLPKDIISTYLSEELKLKPTKIEELTNEALAEEKKLDLFLVEKGVVKEDKLYAYMSQKMDVPLVDLKEKEIPRDTLLVVRVPRYPKRCQTCNQALSCRS
ncbi:MAG: hypothetical protein UW10_C0003G0004 [Candidatus Magasanikbacteria bacterium GW2011_GWA2_43_9]|nr:MAG: hypothetical protein UW10_C0003G0004 [Candidatus Magasanikbacteria bacterium GW2011_GWA2_43_9]